MLKIRYIFRFLWTFLNRFKSLIFLGALFGVLVFLILNILTPYIWGRSSERVGITGRYRPDSLPTSILSMIGEGLTKINSEGVAEPGLAASWETPDLGKTWIFHLSDKKYWQDGTKVTAKSVVYEFSDTTSERPDDKTLVFKLQSPFSPFPSVVAKPTFKQGLLGTGEWRVTNISLSGGYVQEIDLENAKKDKKIYKFYPTEERTKMAYELGQVDKIINIFDPSPLDSWKQVSSTKTVNQDEEVTVFFNTQDKLLSEKSVRQALAYAIKKDHLPGARAISPIAPTSWVYNPQVKSYDYDSVRAKEIINDLPKALKDNLSVKLATTPVLLDEAEIIAADWEAVGVKTTVQVSSGIPTDYQALLAIFDIPADPDQYAIWHSSQTVSNISHYQNPRINKLLEYGRTEVNPETRRGYYLDFQRFLMEDSPAIFLYHPLFYTIQRK